MNVAPFDQLAIVRHWIEYLNSITGILIRTTYISASVKPEGSKSACILFGLQCCIVGLAQSSFNLASCCQPVLNLTRNSFCLPMIVGYSYKTCMHDFIFNLDSQYIIMFKLNRTAKIILQCALNEYHHSIRFLVLTLQSF